jgi:RND family efflux transporter MFP subunit
MKKKIIIASIAVLLLVGGGFAIQNSKTRGTAQQIKTATVTQKTFTKSVQSSGKTKADKSADLKFQTSGKLAWVGVREGDTVAAYQAIAGLDPREVQKTLEKALRDYSNERNDFEEMWRVTYHGVQNPNTALTDTAKRILEKNQWDLDKAVLDVELKHLAVEYATLVTPIAGIVAHIDTPVPGVNITPATAVFEIVDPASLVFAANIDEVDIGTLSLGQTASIALDAFGDATFSGKVSYISYISETSAGGATVFPVKIAFDEPQKLRIGLNGDVTIETSSIPDALLIPIEAIREQNSGKFVYKKTGKTYTLVPVAVGEQNDTEVVITGGLSQGDVVVTKGFSYVAK